MSWYAIVIITGFFSPLAGVLADKSDIIIQTVRKSWISIEKFDAMLQASLNSSQCTNVQISGWSVAAANLFNEFVRIYPNEYTLNVGSLECDGYLTISTSVDELIIELEKIPTTISSTEILFIVDDDIDVSSKIFNASLYQNANADIAARNSLWTLSANYLEPRVFEKVLSFPRKRNLEGLMNFKGRELQVASFYNPPFCYLRTTVNRTVKGIEGQFFVAEREEELDGVEMKIFMLIAKSLNCTWSIRKPNSIHRYGRRNGTNWIGGMIGQIFRKEVDIAFSSIRVKLDHYEFINLSAPAALQCIHFLVPRPKPSSSFWALARPLSLEVWLVILAMLIVQSIYVSMGARISPLIPKRFESFIETWIEMTGRLVGVYKPENMQGLKLHFQLWHFIGVLLVTAYSSSLAARLTNPNYEKRIDTPEDFIAANLSWGKEGVVPIFSDYFDYTHWWASEFTKRYEHEASTEDRHEKIVKGNYAIIGRFVGTIFFPEHDVSRADLRGFRVMKQGLGKFYTAFAVQPWLLDYLNKVLGLIYQAGLVDYHMNDVLHRRSNSALRDLRVERDVYEKRAKVLHLNALGAGFALLIGGLGISTVIFCYELKSVAGSRSIGKLLRDIKTNRLNRSVDKTDDMRRRGRCRQK